MEFATMFFVLKRLDECRNKLNQHNENKRADELKDLQVSMLADKIADLNGLENPMNELTRTEQDLCLRDSCVMSKSCPNYIKTIKSLRERTGLGLGEAKQIVDKFRTENNIR